MPGIKSVVGKSDCDAGPAKASGMTIENARAQKRFSVETGLCDG